MAGDPLRYPLELVSDGCGTIFALFADVPEAMTFGSSEEEALARAARSLRAALDDYTARGLPLPQPSPAGGRHVLVVDRAELLNGRDR